MKVLAAQYLSSVPTGASVTAVSLRLQQTLDLLPISMLLCGWDLPPKYEEAIAEITSRYGTASLRWQPWLAGNSRTSIPLEWQPVSSRGTPINDLVLAQILLSSVRTALEHLNSLLKGSWGFTRAAYTRVFFLTAFASPPRPRILPQPWAAFARIVPVWPKRVALTWSRLKTISATFFLPGTESSLSFAVFSFGVVLPKIMCRNSWNFVVIASPAIVEQVHHQLMGTGLELGLDCYSPSLAYLVGQDLASLDRYCDWIKIMTYPRVNGPAGIPYEILGLVDWLSNRLQLDMHEVLSFMGETSGFCFPATRNKLANYGLDSSVIRMEISSARKAGVKHIFAGIPVVKIDGIHKSTTEQLRQDLAAAHEADGFDPLLGSLGYSP